MAKIAIGDLISGIKLYPKCRFHSIIKLIMGLSLLLL